MKINRLLFAFIFCISLVWGCDDDDTAMDSQAFVVAENNARSFSALGGSAVVNLSETGVVAVSSEDWCKGTIEGTTLTVSVPFNPGLESRSALLTLSKNGTKLGIPISQAGNKYPVANTDKVSFKAKGGTDTVVIEALFTVEAMTEADWLTLAVKEDTLLITATSYIVQGDPRTAWVTYVSGVLKDSLLVEQSGVEFTVSKEKVEFVGPKGYSDVVDVESTFEFAVESKPDWVTVTVEDSKVTVLVADNEENKLREGDVILVMEGINQTVRVVQRPAGYADYLGNWTLSGPSSADGTTITFNLTITAETEGQTYSVLGWSGSGIDQDGYPFIMNFDEETGLVYITGSQNLGKYSTYDILFVGLVPTGGSYTLITGNYIAMVGQFAENKVSWIGQEVTLSDNETYIFAGVAYRAYTGTGYGAFTGDGPFPINPVMTKARNSATKTNFVRNSTLRISSVNSESVMQME